MIAGRPIASIPIAGKQAAQSGISGSATTSQAQTIAASGTVTAPAITGTATTSQAQTIAASGTFIALVTGTGATSQAQTATASGAYTPPLVTGTATTSQAQTTAGSGTFIALVTGTATTSQAQTVAGSGTFTPTGISGTASTSQAQTVSAIGDVSGEVSYGSGPFTYPHELRKRKREAEKELNEQVKKTIRRIAKGVIVGKPATKELEQIKDFASLSALRRSVEFYAAVDKSLAMRKAQDNFAAQEAVRLFILEMERKAQQIEEDDIAFLMMQVVADIE